jgi:hypothetical protein
VFDSGLAESHLRESSRLDEPRARRVVSIPDDFDLFHAFLYYIYTDEICFTNEPEASQLVDVPCVTDVEGMYMLSHRLLCDSVTTKAQQFLAYSCTLRNITAREFSSFAMLYTEVGNLYHKSFMNNWDEVVQSKEFEQYFEEDLEEDTEDYTRAHRKLRLIIRERAKTKGADAAAKAKAKGVDAAAKAKKKYSIRTARHRI